MINIIAQSDPNLDDIRKRYNLPEDEFEEITPQDLLKGQEIPLADLEDEIDGIPSPEADLGPEWSPRPPEPTEFPADQWEEIPTQPAPQLPPEEPEAPPMPEGEVPQPETPEVPEEAEEPEQTPEEESYEELVEEETELDRINKQYTIDQKIDLALAEGYPLRIIYTTLKGNTTERTILPDYYLPARTTGNWVLIAWCELRNDWRGFIVNRIRAAKLEPKE